MPEAPQFSGADLARMALANARKAAPRNPATNRPTKARKVRRAGSGREPITFADAITALGADLPLDAGVAGGSLLGQWTQLCPQYEGIIDAVGYDDSSGRLDLRPSTHAYATQLRLLGGQLAKQINDKMGRPVVRTIRVLPVGAVGTSQPPSREAEGCAPQAPVKTRETASPGYRAALEAALAHKPEKKPTNPYVLEALAAQEAALRAKRQPESEHREAMWLQAEADAEPKPGSMEASERAARARKRQEQAGLTQPRRVFDVA